MSFQPPAPPPGSSDDPNWERDRSPYGHPQPGYPQPPVGPPPGFGGYGAPPPPGYQTYGQPAYGGYARVDHPQGTTILVLGILSLVICQLLGPFAWSMGSKALKEIDLDPNRYSNRGNVVAGKICGMISTILLIVSVGIIVIAIAAAVASSSS
jgi:hypothetical protein